MGNPLKAADSLLSPFFIKYSFYVIFQALAVYFNLYFLIPRYLEKSRFRIYISLLLITMFCTSLFIVSGYYVTASVSHHTMKELFGEGSCIFVFFANALPSTFASMTLAMSIKLTKNWIQTKRNQQQLEKEKLETELKFLKYQFNPHFLFNTINSIFFLIHKNPDMASASLAKFSELLRYQLYECNDIQIPLTKEIAYLENFIILGKLRQNDNIEVDFQMKFRHKEHLGIAPFILMTFVENAFKHVSQHADRPNWIRIKLELDQQQLDFAVSNSTSHDSHLDVIGYGGIGLENVQRRLDLIYPAQYKLDIQNNADSFEVKLRVNLSELLIAQPMQRTA
jgi:LytS/YehU family sensor histidine kinase